MLTVPVQILVGFECQEVHLWYLDDVAAAAAAAVDVDAAADDAVNADVQNVVSVDAHVDQHFLLKKCGDFCIFNPVIIPTYLTLFVSPNINNNK